MPSKSFHCYSVSFHPSLSEWHECKKTFYDNFIKLYGKDKYTIVTEKGNQHIFTHYQCFIEFSKEKRVDTVKKSALKGLLKGIVVAYPTTALLLNPVTRDVKYCQGYTLKETSRDLNEAYFHGYSGSYMLECKDYHAEQVKLKRMGKDKMRISLKNLPEIVKTYQQLHFPEMEFKSKFPSTEIDREKVTKIISRMGLEDYYILPILCRKDFPRIVTYLCYYLTGIPEGMDKYIYLIAHYKA